MPKRSKPPSDDASKNGAAAPPAAPPTAPAGHPALAHGRTKVYDKFRVSVLTGDKALRATGYGTRPEGAYHLLGWGVLPAGAAGDMYDTWGRPVVLKNNALNRPARPRKVAKLKQDLLNHRVVLNGESMIVGETGLTLSCRHRLVALCLSYEEWAGWENADPPLPPDFEPTEEQRARHARWRKAWGDTEPYWETVLVSGVAETPEVIRTLDDTEARTAADVMATDPALYGTRAESGKGADRQKCIKTLTMAMAFVRQRTGEDSEEVDPFHAELTNSEVVEFQRRHAWLRDAVEHVVTEDKPPRGAGGEGLIQRYTGLGAASGLLYLMAAAATDGPVYRRGDPPSEAVIDFALRDRALAFWAELAGGRLPALTDLRRPTRFADGTPMPGAVDGPIFARGAGTGTRAERQGALVRAWGLYCRGLELTPAALLAADDYAPVFNEVGDVVAREYQADPPVTGTRLNAAGDPLPGIDWAAEARDRLEEPEAETPAYQTTAERRTAGEGPTGGLRVEGDDPAAERAARARLEGARHRTGRRLIMEI